MLFISTEKFQFAVTQLSKSSQEVDFTDVMQNTVATFMGLCWGSLVCLRSCSAEENLSVHRGHQLPLLPPEDYGKVEQNVLVPILLKFTLMFCRGHQA